VGASSGGEDHTSPIVGGMVGLEHDGQALLNRSGDADGHLRGGVPVVGAHRAAALLPAAAGGLVTHQLINHPSGEAGVLQPGREGVAKVVGAMQVHRVVGAAALGKRAADLGQIRRFRERLQVGAVAGSRLQIQGARRALPP
jgi:hypothetical protein